MSKSRRTKLTKRIGIFTGLLVGVLGIFFSVAPIANAFDAYGKPPYDAGGYTGWRSYFKDYAPVRTAGYDVLPRQAIYGDNSMPVITDPGSFVNFMRDNYNEAINSDTQDDGSFNFGWRKTGSAFIGWTMLGVSPGNMGPSGTPGSRETSPDWNELLNRLNALNAAGKISWNVPVSTSDYGGVNTRYLGAPYDDVQAVTIPSSVGNGIIFHDYNNNIAYVIRYNCANPLGAFPGIPQKPSDPTWSVNANANGPGSAYPGQTVNFSYNIHNNGPGSAPLVAYGTRYELYSGGTGLGWNNTPGPGDASETLPPGGDITTHRNWSFTIPINYTGSRVCTWISYIPTSSGNGGWSESNHFCVTVNQPAAQCVAFNLIPGSLEPGDTYNAYASVKYANQTAANAAYGSGGRLYVHITGPNGYLADSGTNMDFGPPAASDISGNSPSFPAVTAGTYTVSYGIRGGAIGNKDCADSFTVAYHPYFSVSGGDVSAGNGFYWNGSCTGRDDASIQSWNRIDNVANNYGGGSSGLGAFVTANNGLQHFVSAGDMSGGPGTVGGHGLSFANYDTGSNAYVAKPTFADSIGPSSALPCVRDYQADAPAATRSALPVNGAGVLANGVLSNLSTGNYEASGNVQIGNGGPITLSSGQAVTIYVTGNVYIASDIKYAYNDFSKIPVLRIVVKGGIYISPTVEEIHGVFIAQAAGPTDPQHTQGGIFATCSAAVGTTTTQYGTCNHPLLVVGAVAAENQVILGRSHGSLTADAANGVAAEAAETFRYSPELWLNPANGPATSALTYQAFTSLPPVL